MAREAPTSLLLNVRWVQPGPATAPTALAFTGFGHRIDPWTRLRPAGWRLAVVEFPIGSPPGQVWEPTALAAQLERFWGRASQRALLAFSFGAAGASAVARVLAEALPEQRPAFAAYVAPVQWGKAPWRLLRGIPRGVRLAALRGLARGSGRLMPLVGRAGGASVQQFVGIVERYVGWDFVAHYLPYLDWIDSPRDTVAAWSAQPWPSLLVGGTRDTVIPAEGMRTLTAAFPKVAYREVDSTHFNALDQAAPHINAALAQLLAGRVPA